MAAEERMLYRYVVTTIAFTDAHDERQHRVIAGREGRRGR